MDEIYYFIILTLRNFVMDVATKKFQSIKTLACIQEVFMRLNDGRFYNISLCEITFTFYYRAEVKINSMIETSDMLKAIYHSIDNIN